MFRLMIVDDEKVILNGIRAMIEKRLNLPFPVDISTASSVASALEILPVFTPDLILTDIRMPVMDGFAFIEQIRNLNLICDIVILTSHADFSYAKRAISFHVEDFILKPVESEELKTVLMRCYKKTEQSRKADEKEALSLLRNLLLYDLPPEHVTVEEDFFLSLFPYRYFTIVLVECEENHYDYSSLLEKELSYYYQLCHTFYFFQKKHYITICNHDQFFIETAPVQQSLHHVFLNCRYQYSISISSNSWKELHSLYMNAQLRILYQQLYKCRQDLAEISYITYMDCISIFTEHDKKQIEIRLCQYLDKILAQYPASPVLLSEIRSSFIQNCNIYLENLGAKQLSDSSKGYRPRTSEELIQLIEHDIFSYRQSQKTDTSTVDPDSASRLLTYIDHHYTEDISLESLADAIGMHPNYVCSLFKKHFGLSYLTCLHQKRVEAAKELLRGPGNYTLEEIAAKVGYNSSNQLLRIFKKYENMTPGEYKKMQE